MKTVMVTGVGAIIGYGVLRSLKLSHPDARLIGTDIYPDAVGRAWCDDFVVAPYTSSLGYNNWLTDQIKSLGIDLLIPAIEQDVDFLSDNRDLLKNLNCQVALNAGRLVEVSRDKWLMDRELLSLDEKSRINSINCGTYEELCNELGSPFLLKPRRGYASKGIVRVTNADHFALHANGLGEVLIAQSIVGTDDKEYTVSVFGDGTGELLAINVLKRKLAADGSTAKAVSILPKDVSSLIETVERLVQHFRPIGPTNLQFRETDEGWKLLEMNPRISSSTSIRTAFGYNESAMCYEFYLNGLKPTQPPIKLGHAERYIEEVTVIDRNTV